MYSRLDPEDYNFRIVTGSVKEAIKGTVCSMNPSSTTNNPHDSTTEAHTVYPKHPKMAENSGYVHNSELTSISIIVITIFVRIFI